MKTVKELIASLSAVQVFGNLDASVRALTSDSRKAGAEVLFAALKGTKVDGHDFVAQAVAAGCDVVLVERQLDLPASVTQIVVADTAEALGFVAHAFYNHPSTQLTLVGVTGTNGKTTTTTLLFNLYRKLGYHVGLISTVVNRIGDEVIPSTHTTPDPIALNHLLAQMVESGCSYCFMEVSSHAVVQHRIAGLQFKGAAFTNITHDHLDYHGTFKEYIKAKKGFFDGLLKDAFALVNVDDKNGLIMTQNTAAKVSTYALKTAADFKVKVLENSFTGLLLTINGTELWSRLIGDFNAYNLALVYGVSQLLGSDSTEVLTVLSQLESVDGRFEFIRHNNITSIVDYAHTPDALENVLTTIQSLRTRNESVITVVGCGGDRDAMKRPEMARIACDLSDKVILTSDNPRTEDPQAIINDMEKGVEAHQTRKVLSILDRKQAIKTAVSFAQPGDIILVAGKGHEKYQEINGVRHDFDDLAILNEFFNQLNA